MAKNDKGTLINDVKEHKLGDGGGKSLRVTSTKT